MPVNNPYIPRNKFLSLSHPVLGVEDLSDFLVDLEVVREVDSNVFATFDGTNVEQVTRGVERYTINATWVASAVATGDVRHVLRRFFMPLGTLATFEANPDADAPLSPVITGQCFVDQIPVVPSGAKREVGTFTTSWRTSGPVSVTTPRLWWRRWHNLQTAPATLSIVKALATHPVTPHQEFGQGIRLNDAAELRLSTAPQRSVQMRVVRARVAAGQRISTVRWRSAGDGVDQRVFCGLLPEPRAGVLDFSRTTVGGVNQASTVSNRWQSNNITFTPAFTQFEFFYILIAYYRHTAAPKGRIQISFDNGATWISRLDQDYTQVTFPNWYWHG